MNRFKEFTQANNADRLDRMERRTREDYFERRTRQSISGMLLAAAAGVAIAGCYGADQLWHYLAKELAAPKAHNIAPPIGNCALKYSLLRGETNTGERPVQIDLLSRAPQGTAYDLTLYGDPGEIFYIGTVQSNGIPTYKVELTPGRYPFYAAISVPDASKTQTVIENCNATVTVAPLPAGSPLVISTNS